MEKDCIIEGGFHNQGEAKWIVIRRSVLGHNDTPCEQLAPGRPIGRLSAACRPPVGRLSAAYRPPFGRLSAACRPPVGRLSAAYRPSVGRLSAAYQPPIGRLLAYYLIGLIWWFKLLLISNISV
jgi:hypothetical protein